MAVVEAHDLKRTYKTHTGTLGAARRRSKPCAASLRDRQGRALRAARPERRRQDDDDQDADHAPHPDLGRGARAGLRRRQAGARGAQAHRLRLRRRARRLRALSGYDNLRYFAELYGAGREQKPRIEELLELVGLKGREHERTEGYSRGMKQRLHRPRAAPRPRGRLPGRADDRPRPGRARELRATIASLAEAGKTCF